MSEIHNITSADVGAVDAADLVGDTVDSASDERIVNNVMRHEYRVLDDREKRQMEQAKDLGLQFHQWCSDVGGSEELSLAKTKIEEAVMWAVKHITR